MVANLPYNIATPLLLRVLDDVPAIGSGLVMTQRELGERWTARPGTKAYGVPTVRIALLAEAELVGTVSPNVFLPRPDVTSALVRFRRHERPLVDLPDPGRFLSFLQALFGQRRKVLRNALEAARVDRAGAEAVLHDTGLDGGLRPEQIDPVSLARLHLAVEAARCR
jgi:16S rRNA (adenine1518-N6/adenine1519-N6)-dimethyltransferase